MTPDDRRQPRDRFIAKKKCVWEPFCRVDLDEADRLKYEARVNQLVGSRIPAGSEAYRPRR